MDLSDSNRPVAYTFGNFELDVAPFVLRHDHKPVALGPKVVQTLLVLVERVGQVVTKDELFAHIWPEGYVEEANLSQNIYVLRKVLRAHRAACHIETIPRRGYRFIANVKPRAAAQVTQARRPLRWLAAAAAILMALTISAASTHSQSIASSARLTKEGARLYALGRYYWNLRTPESLARSVQYFNDVIKTDPRSALGYAALADAYSMIEDYSCASMACRHTAAKARAFAMHALRIDPNSAEAHTSLAMVLELFQHKTRTADLEFKRALALNPNYALAHEWYGNSLLERGHMAEARRELEAAIALEPIATATNAWLGTEAYFDRRYSAAIAYFRQALDLNPKRLDCGVMLGLAQEQIHDYAGAIQTFQRYGRLTRNPGDAQLLIAAVYAHMGRQQEALAALQDARRSSRKIAADEVALVFIGLGKRDRALSYMRQARFTSHTDRMWLARDPRWDPVRGDARFRRWMNAG